MRLIHIAAALAAATAGGPSTGSAGPPCSSFSYTGEPYTSFTDVGANCSRCVQTGCQYLLSSLLCVPLGAMDVVAMDAPEDVALDVSNCPGT